MAKERYAVVQLVEKLSYKPEDMIWYDTIWYDMIHLTAIGLTPGGSSTHLHTWQYTEQHNQTIAGFFRDGGNWHFSLI
jgi:hypothetical protein